MVMKNPFMPTENNYIIAAASISDYKPTPG